MQQTSTLVAALVFAGACGDSTAPARATPMPTPRPEPSVGTVALLPNTTDALATFVAFAVHDADSARVLYRFGTGAEHGTAFAPIRDSTRVPLFALPAGVAVTVRVIAVGGGHSDTSAAVTGVVPGVPDVVRRVRLQTTAGRASGGYVLTSVTLGDTAYAVAFDGAGRVAWYRAFLGAGGASDAYQQPNGDFSLYLGRSHGYDPVPDGAFTEFRPTGEVVRQWRAPAGFYTDPHELRVGAAAGTPSYIAGYDLRPTDLTSRGGALDTPIAGHTIFRVDALGIATPVFVARDHFTLADWVIPSNGLGDFDHPNSLDVDRDGDLIVSWRNVGEVSKIDPATGQFVWRLGGPHNEFTFVNDPWNGFGGQHDVRALPNGDLLLYDNGWAHAPLETRVVEYRVDVAAHTATLVWQFRHQPAVFTAFVGSVQRLASGNTFIGYGSQGFATEVDPTGGVVWEGALVIDGARNQSTYRLLKIAALARAARP